MPARRVIQNAISQPTFELSGCLCPASVVSNRHKRDSGAEGSELSTKMKERSRHSDFVRPEEIQLQHWGCPSASVT